MSPSIHPATRPGTVHLTVSDLARSLDFYQSALGLRVHRQDENTAALGAGADDLLALVEQRGARQVRGTTGLYHFAILLPSRLDLARALRRLAETRTPVQGFADHLVSEAIYLPDPDGNGIELYRDRPRDQWHWDGGSVRMATDPRAAPTAGCRGPALLRDRAARSARAGRGARARRAGADPDRAARGRPLAARSVAERGAAALGGLRWGNSMPIWALC